MTNASPSRTLADEAIAYASRGIKVFPLWHTRDGMCVCADGADCGSPGKHPRVPRGVNLATADGRQVAAWWRLWPEANIGLPAGANGLAVIDVDPYHGGDDTLATLAAWCTEKHGIDLMATHTVRTGSGGLHLYFTDRLGDVKSTRRAFGAEGVDTRGRGGYVVAPPSIHASGNRYEAMPSPDPRPWPAVLTRLMNMSKPQPATPAPDGLGPAPTAGMVMPAGRSKWAREALARECEALRSMTREGTGRNDALNIAAYKMGRRVGAGMLGEAETRDALIAAASGWHGHTAREIEATVNSGLRAGIARPHEGPAPRDRP